MKVGKWDWSDNFVIKQNLKPRGPIILSNLEVLFGGWQSFWVSSKSGLFVSILGNPEG